MCCYIGINKEQKMTIGSIVNLIGLCFDVIGATLVFFFGFPQPTFDEPWPSGVLLLNNRNPNYENEVEQVKMLKKKYLKFSRFALSFLVVGFILQAVSDFIP